MHKNFTTNDLIRFIYRETNTSETLAINEALQANTSLYEEYERLIEGFEVLPRVQFRPSDTALDNILNYSRHTTLV